MNSLAICNPDLVKEWHISKNGNLKPEKVSRGSHKLIWWQCLQNSNHIWESTVNDRTNKKTGCPFCSGHRVSNDNSLQTINPKLAKEWHHTKNGKLTPYEVTSQSHKKVWWICNKNISHIWNAQIKSRFRGSGCPYCSGQKTSHDNCLETVNPKLAKEWHSIKNGISTPRDFTSGSDKKIWWQCNKRKDHIWLANIYTRNKGHGCPFCTGKKVSKDNCLQTVNPKLAQEWHPSKNGILTPRNVTVSSAKKVWWLCLNKNYHEWQTTVASRATSNQKCPYCIGRKVDKDNCLQTVNPKLAKEWHSIKNGISTPRDFTSGSDKKIWWQCERFNKHVWIASIGSRNRGSGCPYCTNQSSKLELRIFAEFLMIFGNVKHRHRIFNKECDIYIPNLEIGIEIDGYYWHKSKINLDIEKTNFFINKGISIIRVRENRLPKIGVDDILLNKSYDEFLLIIQLLNKVNNKINDINIQDRIYKYINSKKFINEKYYLELIEALPSPPLKESLKSKNNILSQEWHPVKNGNLKPQDFYPQSNHKVWWVCSKNSNHVWKTKIQSRYLGRGCPFCTSRKVSKDNCLQTIDPQLSKEWHPSKNGTLIPEDVTSQSHKIVWWICRNNKKHIWQKMIKSRFRDNSKCPHCKREKKLDIREI